MKRVGPPRVGIGNSDLSICQIRPMINSQCSIFIRGSGYETSRQGSSLTQTLSSWCTFQRVGMSAMRIRKGP
jgi:hypothetical protein